MVLKKRRYEHGILGNRVLGNRRARLARRYENDRDFMQDKGGVLEEHPLKVVLRKLRDSELSWVFDTITTKDGGNTVYAHMDRGGEELFFESNGDYVTGHVKIPVIGNVCKTEEDINDIVQKTMDFVLDHDVM